jgi:hypothetical protein
LEFWKSDAAYLSAGWRHYPESKQQMAEQFIGSASYVCYPKRS